jgi:Zn-dependent peptidase ImmA (M78 family)/transcriptional regulator with XRE-family HTH domain
VPSIPALVEPAVLRWARETIDLTPLAAARKLGVADDRVIEWEAGNGAPTIAQLRRLAEIYKRSLGVFFLPEPPEGFDTLRDFRRVADAEEGRWSEGLHADYRRAHEQRDHALELAELDDTEPPTTWRIENLPADDEAIAHRARKNLLDVGPLSLPGGRGTVYDHLNAWIAALETAGVLVMATTGGKVSTAEMRAFSLYFDELPVIVVNGSDAPRGRLFSLLHEYAHLLLHTEGLCDTTSDQRATTPDRRLEARCNAIAAAILMPRRRVLELEAVLARRDRPTSWDFDALSDAAVEFGVSAEAFLRRLATLDEVTMAFYLARRGEFIAAYEEEDETERPAGGNWYVTTVRDLGKGYVRLVADARRRHVIDSYTAAAYLDVKVNQIDKLAAAAALKSAV